MSYSGSATYATTATNYGKGVNDSYYALNAPGEVSGDLNVGGNLRVQGTSTLVGAVTCGNALVVNGPTTAAAVTASGAVTAASVASAGAVTAGSVASAGGVSCTTLAASGAATIGGAATFAGGSSTAFLQQTYSAATTPGPVQCGLFTISPVGGASGLGRVTYPQVTANTVIVFSLNTSQAQIWNGVTFSVAVTPGVGFDFYCSAGFGGGAALSWYIAHL